MIFTSKEEFPNAFLAHLKLNICMHWTILFHASRVVDLTVFKQKQQVRSNKTGEKQFLKSTATFEKKVESNEWCVSHWFLHNDHLTGKTISSSRNSLDYIIRCKKDPIFLQNLIIAKC